MTDFLSTSQTARLLDCSEAHVRALANRGDLACDDSPLGRLFRREDVEALKTERAKT
jgi:hypothetical protein